MGRKSLVTLTFVLYIYLIVCFTRYFLFSQARKIQFNSIVGRPLTTKTQKVVVHKHVWSSSNVFLLQGSRKNEKYTKKIGTSTPKSSSHEDDQNSISGRLHFLSGRH